MRFCLFWTSSHAVRSSPTGGLFRLHDVHDPSWHCLDRMHFQSDGPHFLAEGRRIVFVRHLKKRKMLLFDGGWTENDFRKKKKKKQKVRRVDVPGSIVRIFLFMRTKVFFVCHLCFFFFFFFFFLFVQKRFLSRLKQRALQVQNAYLNETLSRGELSVFFRVCRFHRSPLLQSTMRSRLSLRFRSRLTSLSFVTTVSPSLRGFSFFSYV